MMSDSSLNGPPRAVAQHAPGPSGQRQPVALAEVLHQARAAQQVAFGNLLELSSDWYWQQDDQYRFTEIVSIQREATPEALGKMPWDTFFRSSVENGWDAHRATLESHERFDDLMLQITLPTEGVLHYRISGIPRFDQYGRFLGYHGVSRDVTHRKQADEYVHFLATHDNLTNLPNRLQLTSILAQAIVEAQRPQQSFSVLYINLDRFKIINDTLGHNIGDQLLVEIAARLRDGLHHGDVVARLGSDEFVVLLKSMENPAQAANAALKMLAAIGQPMTLADEPVSVTASIGICLYPKDASSEQSLIHNADTAMLDAKKSGKNCFRFFSPHISTQKLAVRALEVSLMRALERNELCLHYQPKANLNGGKICGAEALLRWEHPDLGMISPDQFIPLAEESGIIVPIGAWVLKAACEQCSEWHRAGFDSIGIAVNLSVRQLGEDIIGEVTRALDNAGLDPRWLELEITESMLMQDVESAAHILSTLNAMGIRLAIDDFGVGHSSLAQIKRFPVDTLKIDRSFIQNLSSDPEDQVLTRAIIAMAGSLDLNIVAEGVETLDQYTFLRETQCNEIQGFYLSKPLASREFMEYLANYTPAGQE